MNLLSTQCESRFTGGELGFTSGGRLGVLDRAAPSKLSLEHVTPRNPWLIAMVVTLATFMEVLDTTITNVSLPHIAGNLSASQEESTWVLTSYLVSNAVVLPLSGWLSGIFGRKRFYMTCVFLFTVSSALCGMAPSLGWLIFFRVLQGIGGGGLQPSEQAILVDTFTQAQRGMAMAIYMVAILCAPVLGPTLGGFITDNASWRWVFYINVPVGILSLVLSYFLLEDPPVSQGSGRRAPASADQRRLHRARPHRSRARHARDRARQGAGRGLVLLAPDPPHDGRRSRRPRRRRHSGSCATPTRS